MLNKKNKETGFSLIELLAAMFFVSVALPVLLFAVSRAMGDIENSSLRLRAIYLAQEGIEIVRNIRDTNWLGGVTSTTLEDNLLNNCSNCEADYTKTDLVSWSDRYLKIDSNGFYQYSTGTDTLFKRKIELTGYDLDGDNHCDKLRVKVNVTWKSRGKTSTTTAEEILYNWMQ